MAHAVLTLFFKLDIIAARVVAPIPRGLAYIK